MGNQQKSMLDPNGLAPGDQVIMEVNSMMAQLNQGGFLEYEAGGIAIPTRRTRCIYIKENTTLTMEKQDWITSCVSSILEYAGQELKGEGSNRFLIIQYASYTFKIDVLNDGVNSKFIEPLVKQYFQTGEFTSYQDAINADCPVFAVMPLGDGGHAVLIIGYNSATGQMIYIDPMKGATDRNVPSFFYSDLNFPLIRNRNP